MFDFRKSRFIWRWMKRLNGFIIRTYQGRERIHQTVLMLTTTGRKSGLARIAPLQYEEVDGKYYIGSARGKHADWYQNLLLEPEVNVQIGAEYFHGIAEAITEIESITDFLVLRLERRPVMMRLLLLLEGVGRPTHENLVELASEIVVICITPQLIPEEVQTVP